MPARSSWKGFLRLSLVSIPVKAYTASASGGGEISLNQLHAACHSRIRYKKTCPLHGEVSQDEIVSGYEYAKDQYVVIDTDELDKLRTEGDKAITIDNFVTPDTIDPLYFSDKTYYLTPDGPAGQKSFALLQQAMAKQDLQCVAQVVMHGREQLVLVRPMGRLLAMTILHFENQVKPSATFEDELTATDQSSEELKLVDLLIDATRNKPFDFSQFQDVYTQKLTTLIEAKVAGQELVAPPSDEPQQVINLMEALKASVARAKQAAVQAPKKAQSAVARSSKKKVAPSETQRRAAKTKKRTG